MAKKTELVPWFKIPLGEPAGDDKPWDDNCADFMHLYAFVVNVGSRLPKHLWADQTKAFAIVERERRRLLLEGRISLPDDEDK